MDTEAPPTWSDWAHLPRDERRAILVAGLKGSLPLEHRLRPIAVMWARQWPRRGLPTALLGLLVPVVLLVIAGEGRPRMLSLAALAFVILGVAVVVIARSGILASFRATEEAAKRARAD